MKPKHIVLALPLLCLAVMSYSQQTTFSAGINSGFFKYQGNQIFTLSPTSSGSSAFQPHISGSPGNNPGFSWELMSNFQRTAKSRFIYGAELAFQSFQTKTKLNSIMPSVYASLIIMAQGEAKLTSQFLCLTPFVGYRIFNKKIKIDFTTGMEMAVSVNKKEDITAHGSNGQDYSIVNQFPKRPDQRVRLQLNTSAGRIGLTTGYAIGLKNYYGDDFFVARSRFIRLGLNYRIN